MFEKYTFVKLNKSNFPAMIINKNSYDNTYLVSIVEYQGDYLTTEINDMSMIDLKPEYKLSILGKFGDWFYDQNSDIFQQVILENLKVYL